jgi:hypothetical protein
MRRGTYTRGAAHLRAEADNKPWLSLLEADDKAE